MYSNHFLAEGRVSQDILGVARLQPHRFGYASYGKTDSGCGGQTLRVLPVNPGFARLWRDADSGDPNANEILGQLIDEAPELLGSMVDLFLTACEFARNDMMGDDTTFIRAHKAEISRMVELIKVHHANDLTLALAGELVATCYFDAMRWTYFASEGDENDFIANYCQGMALRSLQQLAAMSRAYRRLVNKRDPARQSRDSDGQIGPIVSFALEKARACTQGRLLPIYATQEP